MSLVTAVYRLSFIACLLVSLSSMAESIQEPYLNPHTYYSQNNEFALSVTPSDRYGFGPASYVLKHGNQELWRKDLAYTFKNAAVSNKGDIAGYSYTKGDLNARSVLQLWVLDAQANVKYSRAYTRHSGAMDGPDVPFITGLVLHNFNNRVTFFIAGIEQKTLGLSILLQTGKEFSSSALDYHYYEFSKLVTSGNSAYSLVQLNHYDYGLGKRGSPSDAEFCLLDKNWKSIFCKTYKDDLAKNAEDSKSRDAFRFSNPSYFGFAESGKFWLSSLKEKRQDYFYIEELLFSTPAVRSIGSKPLVIPKVASVAAKPPAPTKTFKLESERPLPDAILRQRQVADVRVFGIDNNHQKAVLSKFAKHYYFERYDSLNKKTNSQMLGIELGDWRPKNLLRYANNKWVLFCTNYDNPPKTFLLSDKGDLLKEITINMPGSIEMANDAQENFYLLAQKLNEKSTLSQLDIELGALMWTRQLDDQSLYANGFSITDSGQVAVLGHIREKIAYFSLEGKRIRAVEFEKSGIVRSYPTDIKVSTNGMIYVFDFAVHQMLVFSEDKLVKRISLLDAKGKLMEHIHHMEFDSKGNLWASNEDGRLRQFNEAGREVLVIPRVSERSAPKSINWLFVDKDENLFVFDNEQYLLSKIDKENRLVSIYQSAPAMQTSGKSDGRHIGKTNAGFLVREKGGHYVHVDESGRHANGYEVECVNCIAVTPLLNAKSYWRSSFDDINLVAVDGKTIRKIEKDKEGNWLEYPNQFSQNENDWMAIESGGFSHKKVVLDERGTIRASFSSDDRTADMQVSGNHIYIVNSKGALKAYDLTGKLVAIEPPDNEDYCCVSPVLYASAIHKKLYMVGAKSIKIYSLFD